MDDTQITAIQWLLEDTKAMWANEHEGEEYPGIEPFMFGFMHEIGHVDPSIFKIFIVHVEDDKVWMEWVLHTADQWRTAIARLRMIRALEEQTHKIAEGLFEGNLDGINIEVVDLSDLYDGDNDDV